MSEPRQVPATIAVPVRDPSGVGEARRSARVLAQRAGLGDADAGRAAIIVNELGSNVERHGGGGTVLLAGAPGELQVLVVDSGRGIAHLAESLRDGHSTGGTPGTGLGAVARLADDWDLWSAPGAGTAIVARVRAGGRPAGAPASPAPASGHGRHAPDGSGWRAGVVALARPGEPVSGDACAWRAWPGGLLLLLADGLGHGPDAADAAAAAVRATFAQGGRGPGDTLAACWDALRATRGAALALASIDAAAGHLRFAGAGNVVAAVVGAGGRRNLVSQNGTAGQGVARVREFDYPWQPGDTLIAHTDGLDTRWSERDYAGALARDPALLAGLLWRDHVRARDDATVVVLREDAPAPGAGGAP